MTRVERRQRRRRETVRRLIASTAALLMICALGCAVIAPWAGEPEPAAETPAVQTSTPAAVSPVSYAPDLQPVESDAVALAKMAWGEARGCSVTEQAGAMWCALNRTDDPVWPDSVAEVVAQPMQFVGYSPENPVTEELLALANDVLARWYIEDTCVGGVGRVLPKEYLYFTGDGKHNHFTTEWRGGTVWDWSLPSPYEG